MNMIITKATVDLEYREASEYGSLYGWEFSAIDYATQQFTVKLVSSVDQEPYWFEFRFDDYPEKPYIIEPLYPPTGERNIGICFPKGYDSFFHTNLFICHPCSRKAYSAMAGPHADWTMANWRSIAGGLTNLRYILDAFYHRICNKTYYDGRMVKAAARP